MPDPLVSVIIPAYNAERFLARALDSVLGQTYCGDIELIVVDDGSTDATPKTIRGYRHTPLFRHVRQPNAGPGAARNTGIKLSHGAYVTFLDSDDYYQADKVEAQVQFLRVRPDTIAYCDALHYESGRPERLYRRRGPRPSGNILPWLMGEPLINPNTVMYPRKVFEVVGLFDSTYNFPEEWDLYIRACRAGFEFVYQERDLVVVQVRPDSMIKWDNQPELRARTITMLERLLPEPFEVNGRIYDPEVARKRLRMKLALAYLATGRRREFIEAAEALPWPLVGSLLLLPSTAVRAFWRMNRLRSVDFVR